MARNDRVNMKAILAHPDLRRKLMVRTIQATQAREGIETTEEQAERAYYVVTEGEQTAFFDLESFRGQRGQPERRQEVFVRHLRRSRSAIASTSPDVTFARSTEHRSRIGE